MIRVVFEEVLYESDIDVKESDKLSQTKRAGAVGFLYSSNDETNYHNEDEKTVNPGNKIITEAIANPNPIQIAPQLFEKKTHFIVNGNAYRRLDVIGKGGSCKVYKILLPKTNKTYALKKVKLNGLDPSVCEGYMNEIELLGKLKGHPRIIELIEFEVTKHSNELLMVN